MTDMSRFLLGTRVVYASTVSWPRIPPTVGWPGSVVFSPRFLAPTETVMRAIRIVAIPPTPAGQPGGCSVLLAAPAPFGH